MAITYDKVYLRERSYTGWGIENVVYGPRPPFEPKHTSINSGTFLEKRKGFGFNVELPTVCFKTLRAMINYGLESEAQKVLQTKMRSYITADHVWDSVLSFGSTTAPMFTDEYLERAFLDLEYQVDIEKKIHPISLKLVSKNIPQSTSPGLPWIQTHPGFKKGDIIDLYHRKIELHWQRIANHQRVVGYDCAAFARSHISNIGENKVRPVWAVPLHNIYGEGIFAEPLIRELTSQRIGHNTAYGMEMLKGGMFWLNSQILDKKVRQSYIMTDYSSYDSTIPAWLIRRVFALLKRKFDFTKTWNGSELIDSDPNEYENMYRYVVNYFINTPIRNMDGRRFQKNHGIPSGSYFTNIIGTFVNFVITRFYMYRTNIKCIMDIYFGDDSFFSIPEQARYSIPHHSEVVEYYFGLKLNLRKTVYTSNPRKIHFLGYYNNNGTPSKPASETIAAMLYPQYNKDDWAYTVSRALGCLFANAGSSNIVYDACTAVFLMANNYAYSKTRNIHAVDYGIYLIQNNPRALRRLKQLGCNDEVLTPDYFTNKVLSIPHNNCTKLRRNVCI